MSLSVIAIMKDEEKNIVTFLKSFITVADEIILVDTGSTDRTVTIAKKLGFTDKGRSTLKLRYFKWKDDFAAARNFALSYARCDWVMWADLDDTLEKNAPQVIHALKKTDRKDAAFGFLVASESGEEGVYNKFMQARMFPNNRGVRWERTIHEKIVDSIKDAGLSLEPIPECAIIHSGYTNPVIFKNKMLRNAKMLEELNETSYDKFYQLGDAYFGANAYDLGIINYARSRELARTPLQYNSATERIVFGHMLAGAREAAALEITNLPDGIPEKSFWEGEMYYTADKKEESIPFYEKVLQYEYEPGSMTSYLDAYKDRAIRIIKKVKGEDYSPEFAQQTEKELV
jgi:glycosyltransferase involved in cell wall biosynthesis